MTESDGGREATKATPLGAIRAFGVMLGGPILLLAVVVASLVAAAIALAEGDRPPWPALAVLAAAALYALALRPWFRRWGSTEAERERPLPGDELLVTPDAKATRAISIDAAPDDVWPWIAQLGQGRGGFYSYEWLENLAGCEMRNADRIHPEWQRRKVGETVLLHPASGLKLIGFDPPRSLVLEGWGAWVVEPDGEGGTRLLIRSHTHPGIASLLYALLLELPHFLMERKMLLGIKRRAELAA